MDYSPPGSSVHGISQGRVLEWVASPFSRGSSHPRDQTQVSALQADSSLSEPPGSLRPGLVLRPGGHCRAPVLPPATASRPYSSVLHVSRRRRSQWRAGSLEHPWSLLQGTQGGHSMPLWCLIFKRADTTETLGQNVFHLQNTSHTSVFPLHLSHRPPLTASPRPHPVSAGLWGWEPPLASALWHRCLGMPRCPWYPGAHR